MAAPSCINNEMKILTFSFSEQVWRFCETMMSLYGIPCQNWGNPSEKSNFGLERLSERVHSDTLMASNDTCFVQNFN